MDQEGTEESVSIRCLSCIASWSTALNLKRELITVTLYMACIESYLPCIRQAPAFYHGRLSLILDRITFTVNQRDVQCTKVLNLMRETKSETHFCISFRKISERDDLDRTEERHKPRMIIPGALVSRISEIGVFKTS